MKEVITLCIGQAGVQIGNAAWELFCLEHGIHCDGTTLDPAAVANDPSYLTFFRETVRKGKPDRYVPRTIFCDLESSVVDEVRCGAYRDLFNPEGMLTGIEDAANNYARGHFTQGKTMIPLLVENIRKLSEECDNLESFIVLCSFGGGTGTGLTALVNEQLHIEFSHRTKVQGCIFPGGVYSTAVVEPYNCFLSVNSSLEHSDLSLQFDNEALYTICKDRLRVVRPSYTDVNRVVAQVLSTMTCSIRFENLVNADLTQVQTNLVPYPRIHFPVASYAPYQALGMCDYEQSTVGEITHLVFQSDAQLSSCNMIDGKFMAISLQYRGKCSPSAVNRAISSIKQGGVADLTNIQFVDWSPTGFKVGICNQPSIVPPNSPMGNPAKSVCCLANNTDIVQMWRRIGSKFDVLFGKRAFVHWYVGEGMEEGEFVQAKEALKALRKDYEELSGDNDGEEGDDEGEGGGEVKVVDEENKEDGEGATAPPSPTEQCSLYDDDKDAAAPPLDQSSNSAMQEEANLQDVEGQGNAGEFDEEEDADEEANENNRMRFGKRSNQQNIGKKPTARHLLQL